MNLSQLQEKAVVAAFDFDGTITKRDTLLSFLFYVAGRWPAVRKLTKLTPHFLEYLVNRLTRQQAKEMILQSFFAGMPISQLEELGKSFADSDELRRLIYPDALERIDWHRRQQHRCILVSASIDIYLKPWSQKAGFDDLICSTLEVDDNGIVSGHLQGLNCWGAEKERRLEEIVGPRGNFILYAYGDSRGDYELLSVADYPFFKTMPSSSYAERDSKMNISTAPKPRG